MADDNFLVARYNPDGSLDPSFSGDGRVQTNFTGSDGATDVALRGNKIVVVGFSTDNTDNDHLALARYTANGSLDPSFSGDGMQTTDFSGFENWASGVAVQGDGKIVAVGSGADDFALIRYNPNGSLDATFSGDGKQTTDFGGNDEAYALALQRKWQDRCGRLHAATAVSRLLATSAAEHRTRTTTSTTVPRDILRGRCRSA